MKRKDVIEKKFYLFTGYYGFDNFGDDLFPLSCHCWLASSGDSEAVILSPPIPNVPARFIVPRKLAKIYKSGGLIGKALRLFFTVYGAFRFKNVVLAGGSTIASGSSLLMRKAQFWLSKLNICRLYAIGVSVGPFEDDVDRRFAKKFIDQLRFLAVRDVQSQEQCIALGVSVIPALHNDLAGALPLQRIVAQPTLKQNRRVLGISICPYESVKKMDEYIENARNTALFEGVARFCSSYGYAASIIVLNSNENIGDLSLSRALESYLRRMGVDCFISNYEGPCLSLSRIGECNLFISVRLHGAISAYLLGVPFLLVEYHRKCSDFLDNIGFSIKYRISGRVGDGDVVYKSLEALHRGEVKSKVTVNEYQDNAVGNFCFLSHDK
ncbi:polysaccharide pyruvyl transferase family protein [Stutzerimonas stutzeri]|uniref:polysaccharide pyruvyl transferase family protein n=1 Tax=Stutzerimonas stutzeri TaxID=316 RepID=UPI001C753645|nr:polysaccharide pyruvyl transferase family protein [Stutzerimonas stutzeri]BCY01818.1 polysaccharide pyruvyl transferase CsaB [Stutzerimonas stutzeri]